MTIRKGTRESAIVKLMHSKYINTNNKDECLKLGVKSDEVYG